MYKGNEDKRNHIFNNKDNIGFSLKNNKSYKQIYSNSSSKNLNTKTKHKISLTEENLNKNIKKISKEAINYINSNRLSTQSNNDSSNSHSSRNYLNKEKQTINHIIELNYNDTEKEKEKEKENESINIIDNSDSTSLIYNTYTINKKQKINNTQFQNFLSEIGISKNYATLLNINGFDDLNLLIEQTKTGIAITDKILKDIGISSPGKRAKILIHIEEEAHLFDFQIEKEKVYFINERNENSLFKLLSSINLEYYFNNFKINDYSSPELLFVQMKTRQPLTDEILRYEIGIEKLGYRMRIINKIKSECINYIQKLHNGNFGRNNKNNIVYFERKNNGDNSDFCNMCCII